VIEVNDDPQLSLKVLAELLGLASDAGAAPKALADQLAEQTEQETRPDDDDDEPNPSGEKTHRHNRKPTGRATARELPKVLIEMLPDEVKRLGLDAFERVGQETATTVERRVSSLVEVTVERPKFRAKTDSAIEAVKLARGACESAADQEPQAWFVTSPALELPIARGMAGPALLANVAVRRFDDHLPYNRLENVYEREGMRIGRSTLFGWLDALRPSFKPLIDALLRDAKQQPYLCVDATGVLVLAPEKCTRGHFWVLIAPERHIVFAFSHSHDSDAVDKRLGGYEGFVVADAHAVYDHLYTGDGATEVGCWGHARSYFFKTLATEPEIAKGGSRQPARDVHARA
jgi:transposase